MVRDDQYLLQGFSGRYYTMQIQDTTINTSTHAISDQTLSVSVDITTLLNWLPYNATKPYIDTYFLYSTISCHY